MFGAYVFLAFAEKQALHRRNKKIIEDVKNKNFANRKIDEICEAINSSEEGKKIKNAFLAEMKSLDDYFYSLFITLSPLQEKTSKN